jgi:hypothetical protein
MRASEKAWIGLGAGVAAYDVLCPKGETLSEGMDRFLEHDRYRYVALGGVAVTAAHLLNLLPERYDPFARALSWKDRGGDVTQE